MKKTVLVLITFALVIAVAGSGFWLVHYFIDSREQRQTYENLAEEFVLESTPTPESNTPAKNSSPTENSSEPAESVSLTTAPPRHDLAALAAENPDCVGWLTIPDTGIDYPITVSYTHLDVYKRQEGRRKEIKQALLELRRREKSLSIPEDLCYVYGDYFEEYLYDVEICREFAARNRELLSEILLERCKLKGKDGFHTVHNYIDGEEMILRKGAIAAHKGEKVLIPINMRDGSLSLIHI